MIKNLRSLLNIKISDLEDYGESERKEWIVSV